jgi:hypothetical protein
MFQSSEVKKKESIEVVKIKLKKQIYCIGETEGMLEKKRLVLVVRFSVKGMCGLSF